MVAELLDCTPQEQEWLEGCRRASPKAQKKVFERYYGLVYGTCIRYLSSKEMAQEALNDCFLKLFYQLESACRYPEYFRRWLRRLAVYTAVDAYRKEKQYLTDISIDDQAIEIGIPETLSDNLQAEQIIALLAQLPDLWRLTFNLYEIEGYSHEEIAHLLAIPMSSSRVYLTRAKQRLRELLREEGSVRTAMPIYYVPTATHSGDPDWRHFRERLDSYEPMPDGDAWQRFERVQQRQHQHRRWQTAKLIVLVAVGVVCEKSQAPGHFWPKSQVRVTSSTTRLPSSSAGVNSPTTTYYKQGAKTDQTAVAMHDQPGEEHHPVDSKENSLSSISNQTPSFDLEKSSRERPKDSIASTNGTTSSVNRRLPESLADPEATAFIEKRIARKVTATGRNTRPNRAKAPVVSSTESGGRFRQMNNRGASKNRLTKQSRFYASSYQPTATNQTAIYSLVFTETDEKAAELITINERFLLPINKLLAKPFLHNRIPTNQAVVVRALSIERPQLVASKHSINVGVLGGVQAVYTPTMNQSFGVTGGIWADWQLNRKLVIEMGLSIARPQLMQAGNGLITQDSLNRRELVQQTYQWWTMTLPLTIRYRIVETKRVSWWGALGVSSGLTFGETQRSDYRLTSFTSNPTDSSHHASSSTDQVIQFKSTSVLLQPFRWLTVSSGVRLLTVGKQEWWMEPYFSYPIGVTTSESLRVSMAGIRLRLRLLKLN
ncbi:sigma-70 family RNA polymerase sigma factor [Spirosoma foliorum]|uniref:Sigma-70 family RNA polymerase sigma factor n=1 Tax=Spirosoma foliorum TaxID=2710596 RepID=A0A7G5GZ76_9BACT|nr:sigma-70 family RNA polymerase sigma factor [Spirosoma foliorum]QMW04168.1 sigma-70 family RNA polymerase sigma factor [Spirosoma foliorum]